MGTEIGREAGPLRTRLLEEGERFEFFQAVRLLQLLRQERGAVGRDEDPEREAVRFRGGIGVDFPTSDVAMIGRGEDDRPTSMDVAFMGVATPASFGSLPLHYAQLVREEVVQQKHEALRDFFDIFNHRLISLFYRAWEKYHFPIVYERSSTPTAGVF